MKHQKFKPLRIGLRHSTLDLDIELPTSSA